MKTAVILIAGIFFSICSCEESAERAENSILSEPGQNQDPAIGTVSTEDTLNSHIYNFMKVLIADQKLNSEYGLEIKPEQSCDLGTEDQEFLKKLLKEDSKPGTGNNLVSSNTSVVDGYGLPACLSGADIEDMLLQKEALTTFSWDNSRLGFNTYNLSNWSSFSIPLFSKDKKTVVIMIRDLCAGLCGSGRTMIFTNDNGEWSSRTGQQWLH